MSCQRGKITDEHGSVGRVTDNEADGPDRLPPPPWEHEVRVSRSRMLITTLVIIGLVGIVCVGVIFGFNTVLHHADAVDQRWWDEDRAAAANAPHRSHIRSPRFDADDIARLLSCKVDELDRAAVRVKAENPLDVPVTLAVKVRVYDADAPDGPHLDIARGAVDDVAPGETIKLTAFGGSVLNAEEITCILEDVMLYQTDVESETDEQ